VQHSATQCNTVQHTATHCNTLQHTATHCNTLQHTATHCNLVIGVVDVIPGQIKLSQGCVVPQTNLCCRHCYSVLQCGVVFCNVVQCGAVRCSVV